MCRFVLAKQTRIVLITCLVSYNDCLVNFMHAFPPKQVEEARRKQTELSDLKAI